MGIKSVPTLFFHDAKGTIVSKEIGFMPEAKILELAEQAYNTPVEQSLDEFFDLEQEVEVEVEVVDSLGEDLEVDIVAEVEKDEVEVLTPPTAEDEEVIFTPPHTIFDEQPEDELVVEDEAAEDIEPLV